ncbi:amidohydrolase family protein [Amycolatopsis rhabdoformis]|uniref:Amidohydrolase family protein n=1 Tax=Amycolatopsis rhabdoformis TaxID=1448059 RepID=A0ABZ1IFW2_9PSEU|nr:amidohydrolase family protein [Amycolatopsis rhabdoformis]WSE32588.1 amidohydrolase family protein [Amycolatopsis rhabdoformis]
MTGRLFRRVEVAGRVVDVRTDRTRITEIGQELRPRDETVIDGGGGALIPGLHDHHLHLLAMAAARASVDLSEARTPEDLRQALATQAQTTPEGTWIRATGYHEAPDRPPLERGFLDRCCPRHPVRVQHRGGALWVLNSSALAQVPLDDSPDVDRGPDGAPTGRLFRYDERLRGRLPREAPDLAAVGAELNRLGLTRVTDATPDLDPAAIGLLTDAVRTGRLPVELTLLGAPTAPPPAGFRLGPEKLLLPDHRLPPFDELCARVEAAHAHGRAVAVHCVTRESLILTLAALDQSGPLAGDRIEHCAVAPPDLYPRLQNRTVVTQPAFLRDRGDDYRREVHPDDVPWLYPYRSLLDAGVEVLPSSDAPFGPLDPWQVLRCARDRTTRDGHRLGAGEAVETRVALAGYVRGRTVEVGQPADLVLLHEPLRAALRDPDAALVRTTFGPAPR